MSATLAVQPPTPATGSLRYAILIGQGRSGTNHLLRILNQSAETHCRNEADRMRDNALRDLEGSRFYVQDEAALEAGWDAAIRDTALHMGARDQPFPCAKSWLFPGSRKPGIFFIRQRYRLLHRLGRNGRPMDGNQARFPRWMTTPARLESAFHVFKLNAASGFADFVLRRRPQGKVVHLVRHPGGFTRSWLQRWVEQRADTAALESCRQRLRRIVEHDPDWACAAGVGDPATTSYVEAELWFWRYCNETVARAGEGRPNYLRVVYEDLAEDPLNVARRVYDFLGLPWTERITRAVASMSERSPQIASAWRSELEPEFVQKVDRVTAESPLLSWWDPQASA